MVVIYAGKHALESLFIIAWTDVVLSVVPKVNVRTILYRPRSQPNASVLWRKVYFEEVNLHKLEEQLHSRNMAL